MKLLHPEKKKMKGDEIGFKMVELQGWVPHMSDYKRAVVESWTPGKHAFGGGAVVYGLV